VGFSEDELVQPDAEIVSEVSRESDVLFVFRECYRHALQDLWTQSLLGKFPFPLQAFFSDA